MSRSHAWANAVEAMTPRRQPVLERLQKSQQRPVQQLALHVAYRRAQVNTGRLMPAELLTLQRTIGNRQAQRMLARRTDDARSEKKGEISEEDPGIKVQTKLKVGVPDDISKQEANRVAGQVIRAPGTASQSSFTISAVAGAQRKIFRTSIALRSGNQITDTAGRAGDNNREEVLLLLDRLHTLWSIDNDNYDNQHRYIAALPTATQVPQTDPAMTPPWSFQPTIDALRRNGEPTLSAPVIRHHMGGVSVTDGVGRGLANNKADVLNVQDRLNFLKPYGGYAAEHAATAALTTPTVPDPALGGTYAAIADFKEGIASGRIGWLSVRASESEFGGDRFAGQTASITLNVLANHATDPKQRGPRFETRQNIQASIFLPSQRTAGGNDVFVFFSPGDATETSPAQAGANATNVHALRSGADQTNWIVIGVPGWGPPEVGWNTIDTAAIQTCLVRAGLSTTINKLRLAAHSRGMRGLKETVARRLIDVSLVDQVIALDIGHRGLAGSLASAIPRGGHRPPIIDYTQGIGGAGRALNAEGVRAIGFARLIQDRPDVPPPAGVVTLLAPILTDLPPRGSFTTGPVASGATGGKVNIHDWIRRHTTEIARIARVDGAAQTEWFRFVRAPRTTLDRSKVDSSPYFHVNTQNLMRFFPWPLIDPATGRPRDGGFSLGIYAHHLFVAEVSDEMFG